MKKIGIVCCLFIAGTAFGQKVPTSKVPKQVIVSFNKNFADIVDVKWDHEKPNYEANFKKDNNEMAALFDTNGSLLETETAIDVSALPLQAKEYLSKNYNGSKVKEAAKLIMANGDINYEVEVKGMDLIFDVNGRFIKMVKD